MTWAGRRYWLVGASEGLGRALAHVMSAAGAELILSGRNEDRLRELASELPGAAHPLPFDVTDPAAVRTAAEAAGTIDGIVWLAGAYWPLRAQEWNAEKVTTMIDTNLTGAAHVLGAVVPEMVGRGAGHIVIVGSLSGFRGLPGAIGYAASKAGLMNLAECLAIDLAGSGVRVQLVNPGFIRTRLTARNDFSMPFLMEPEAAARHIFGHMNRKRFATSFPRLFSLVFRLGRLLPDALWVRLMR